MRKRMNLAFIQLSILLQKYGSIGSVAEQKNVSTHSAKTFLGGRDKSLRDIYEILFQCICCSHEHISTCESKL